MRFLSLVKSLGYFICSFNALAHAFNVNCNSNYVSYYGQNSAGNQKSLGAYCQDATEDLIVLAFMHAFPNMGLNFANACETTFDGSTLLHCPNMAADIKYCQSKGKAVILSMGGASGAYGFSSDADGIAFADTVWNTFFKGSSAQRPFDDAVLDGIDLDIEGGSPTGYAAFINQLRKHYASDSNKQYYIAAAPQCPYPDAYLGSTLNSAWFDMVYVQFYNNYCGLNAYPSWFNYGDWDNWAKTKSVNKNVKVYIGAPGSPSAASSGYVDGATLGKVYNAVRSNYTSLGGVMTWDVSQSRTSGLANSIRSFLNAGGTCKSPGDGGSTTSTPASTSTKTVPDTSSSSTGASPPYTTKGASDTPSNTPTSTPTSTPLTSSDTLSSTVSSSSSCAWGTWSAWNVWCLWSGWNGRGQPHSTPGQLILQPTRTDGPIAKPSPAIASKALINAHPAPNSPASMCPVQDSPCARLTQGCNKSGYALCIGGKWAVYQCAAGTSCYLFNSVAACDWEGAHPGNDCVTSGINNKQKGQSVSLLAASGSSARPFPVYTTQGVSSRIEFMPITVSSGKYTALIKMQTLLQPYSQSWMLELQLPPGQTIDHTSRGSIVGNGTSVTIKSDKSKEKLKRMAIVLEVSGTYTGKYSVPDQSTARVTAY